MAKWHPVLLQSDDPQTLQRWTRELGDWAHAISDLTAVLSGASDMPELVIADQLPFTQPMGTLGQNIASGAVAVVGIGTAGTADVLLPTDYRPRELRLTCHLLAEVVSVRRSLAAAHEQQRSLQRMVYRDPLTGLANRRKWDRELTRHFGQLHDAGDNRVLGLVLLDLDLFKQLNDRLGHVAGDAALRHAAQKLSANLADQHLAARLGGDEFGVLLSGLLADDVAEVAERVRQSLEQSAETGPDTHPSLTASAGVAIIGPADASRPREALEAADAALRSAKQAGRNCLVVGSLP